MRVMESGSQCGERAREQRSRLKACLHSTGEHTHQQLTHLGLCDDSGIAGVVAQSSQGWGEEAGTLWRGRGRQEGFTSACLMLGKLV